MLYLTGIIITFFLVVILAGAVFLRSAVMREVRIQRQQQNFMMAITHELKTPIAVTKLNLETLQKRKLDEAQQQKLIQNTIQENNRMNALCNNILLVSQIEDKRYHITKEDIELSELVKECINDFGNRFPQRHYIPDIADNILIKGDKFLLQLAVNNLIDNATKYSEKEKPGSLYNSSIHPGADQVRTRHHPRWFQNPGESNRSAPLLQSQPEVFCHFFQPEFLCRLNYKKQLSPFLNQLWPGYSLF